MLAVFIYGQFLYSYTLYFTLIGSFISKDGFIQRLIQLLFYYLSLLLSNANIIRCSYYESRCSENGIDAMFLSITIITASISHHYLIHTILMLTIILFLLLPPSFIPLLTLRSIDSFICLMLMLIH